jgi:hypothetical protein
MPIIRTQTVTCDHCGRKPNGDDPRDSGLFGWVIVTMEHLNRTGMGHNEIDVRSGKVLCDDCRYREMEHLVSPEDFRSISKNRF